MQTGFEFAPAPEEKPKLTYVREHYRRDGDVTRRKHGGNRNSEAANVSVQSSKAPMRERVRIFVSGCDWHGATLHEISKAFGKLPHQVSGRISELKQAGALFDSGRNRQGAAVLVARNDWVNGGRDAR